MTKMTPEAKKLSATVQALGVPRKSLSVSSNVGKDSYLATAVVKHPEHEHLVLDHIDHLNNRGINVTTMGYSCGHRKLVGMQDAFGQGEHRTMDFKDKCPTCRSN
jgi:hypothetical protein